MYQGVQYGCRQRCCLHTVMHNSKLPFFYWVYSHAPFDGNKALELQRQLIHKRYQPNWEHGA